MSLPIFLTCTRDRRSIPLYGERIPFVICCKDDTSGRVSNIKTITCDPHARLFDKAVNFQEFLHLYTRNVSRLCSDYYVMKQILPALERVYVLISNQNLTNNTRVNQPVQALSESSSLFSTRDNGLVRSMATYQHFISTAMTQSLRDLHHHSHSVLHCADSSVTTPVHRDQDSHQVENVHVRRDNQHQNKTYRVNVNERSVSIVNVLQWWNEAKTYKYTSLTNVVHDMSRMYSLHPYFSLMLYKALSTIVDDDNIVPSHVPNTLIDHQTRRQVATLSAFLNHKKCFVCHAAINVRHNNLNICPACVNSPGHTMTTLFHEAQRLESRAFACTKTCSHCGYGSDLTPQLTRTDGQINSRPHKGNGGLKVVWESDISSCLNTECRVWITRTNVDYHQLKVHQKIDLLSQFFKRE